MSFGYGGKRSEMPAKDFPGIVLAFTWHMHVSFQARVENVVPAS